MPECVKCGQHNPRSIAACARCTWPLIGSAWLSTTFIIRRISLDTGCVNAKGKDPSLNTLEQWASFGYLQLQRSDVMLQELIGDARVTKAQSIETHPGLFILGASMLDGPDVLASPDLRNDLRRILFPTANPLTSNQVNDIEHLRLHVQTGGDAFVTLNINDFITRGRQTALAAIGIWVFTPKEIVTLLMKLYNWTCTT